MVRGALCKVAKGALPKSWVKMPNWSTSLRWKIPMATENHLRNKFPVLTEVGVSSQEMDVPIKSKNPELKKSFRNTGIRNIKDRIST